MVTFKLKNKLDLWLYIYTHAHTHNDTLLSDRENLAEVNGPFSNRLSCSGIIRINYQIFRLY